MSKRQYFGKKMEKDTVVQIIVPVYNAEKMLSRCLESLLAQTFSLWQAIIVDDASEDGSEEVIKSYQKRDKRFVYIKNETNRGVSASRNEALKRVSAPFVAFIDSDDFWEKEYLEKMYAAATENDADIVQCRYMYDYPNGRTYIPKGAFSENKIFTQKDIIKIYKKMATGIDFNHVCMKLIKSDLIKGKSFDTTLKTAEDLAFNTELLYDVKKYVFLNEIYYHYLRSGNSLTGQKLTGREKLAANRKASKKMKESLEKTGEKNLFISILIRMRPYTITASKIIRMIRDRRMASN